MYCMNISHEMLNNLTISYHNPFPLDCVCIMIEQLCHQLCERNSPFIERSKKKTIKDQKIIMEKHLLLMSGDMWPLVSACRWKEKLCLKVFLFILRIPQTVRWILELYIVIAILTFHLNYLIWFYSKAPVREEYILLNFSQSSFKCCIFMEKIYSFVCESIFS